MIRRQLINFQNRSVDVRVGLGAFDELSRMFASAVGKPKRAMVVWNTATSERFGEVVEHALVDAGFAVSLLVLEVSPAGATLADADAIFGALSANGVTCDDLVVAVGDAATCSVVSWCANQWCGRTECALLPTTFDAMLTVATTMKPLVASSANALPAIAFRPEPGLVVCDLDLVREADPEDLKLGFVVLVGTMLSSSKSRWNQFTETVPEILVGEEVALGATAPLIGTPANDRAGRRVADSDNEIVAGNAVSRQGAKNGIGIGQRSTGRRNLEDKRRHGKTGIDQRMLNDLAKAIGHSAVPDNHRALGLAHGRGKHARQLAKRVKADANIYAAVLEIDELTANHSSPRSKSISAQT